MSDGYFDLDNCDLAEFREIVSRSLSPDDVPLASEVVRNVPVYDAAGLADALADPARRRMLLAEWGRVLGGLSGVLVLREAYADTSVLDAATAVYEGIIAQEKADGAARADHFATAGANDRIWNALQKLCVADPALYARYFGNAAIAAVAEAWLGPFYQMTAQINVVRPGGKAQEAHRDYHLGFQTAEISGRFPAHMHDLSAVLTLQGAVAHCDMPVESGPTKLLPFSQLYRPGYMAYRRADFRAFFDEACIQLPLRKGDAVFFSPALFHAAGDNRSRDIDRMANLLQISSAFGRAMETVDREAMCERLYPVLRDQAASGSLGPLELEAVIAATAEGYSFPTNLDRDPPVGGLAPQTQAALIRRAIDGVMPEEDFQSALRDMSSRRRASA